MLPVEPSMASLADVLPFPDASDLSERFLRLSERLRAAPISGDGSDIFEIAANALGTLPPDPVTHDRAMCWLFIARHRLLIGSLFPSLDAAVDAVAIAERLGEDGLLGKALKLLGAVYTETGNFPAATSALSRALPACRRAHDSVNEAEVFLNLGNAHLYASQFSTAVPCYERALEIAQTFSTSLLQRATPLGNIALASLHLRDFQRGLIAAEQAIEILAVPNDPSEQIARAMTEFYYTRLLLEVRNVPLALEHAKLARKYARGAGALAELFADLAQGFAEVHAPATVDIGLSRLQRVISECRRGVPSVLRDALATIVRAYEVIRQPNNALVFQREVLQLNRDSRVKNLLEHHHRHVVEVRKGLDERADAALDLQQHQLQFQRFETDHFAEFTQVLEENTVTVEFHDDETGEHCYRVGAMARELAKKSGMDPDECKLIDLSARLHDVGKIRIPQSILLKPGKFTPEERAIMEQHCEFGREIISEGGLGQLFIAQEIAFNHHERWDGSGYPRGIKGDMIPLVARISALADVYDALRHRRPYKRAWSMEETMQEIKEQSGKHFDPRLTQLFLELVPELEAQHGDLDSYLSAESRKNDLIINRARLARELKADEGTFDARR